jgi:hypothetical protein
MSLHSTQVHVASFSPIRKAAYGFHWADFHGPRWCSGALVMCRSVVVRGKPYITCWQYGQAFFALGRLCYMTNLTCRLSCKKFQQNRAIGGENRRDIHFRPWIKYDVTESIFVKIHSISTVCRKLLSALVKIRRTVWSDTRLWTDGRAGGCGLLVRLSCLSLHKDQVTAKPGTYRELQQLWRSLWRQHPEQYNLVYSPKNWSVVMWRFVT